VIKMAKGLTLTSEGGYFAAAYVLSIPTVPAQIRSLSDDTGSLYYNVSFRPISGVELVG